MASSLVVVVDRWGAGFLGPYGNTWLETPACCRLAGEAFLVEHALADSLQLGSLYRSYWQGRHAACRDQAAAPSLAALLAQQRVTTQLISDEPQVLEHPLAATFEDRLAVAAAAQRTAAGIDRTQLANLFGETLAWLEHAPDPFHLWVHATAMEGAWDAPYEMRQALADEEDPDPPRSAAVPRQLLTGEVDPDELLGATQAYGAQVQVFDRCLGVLLERLASAGTLDRTLVAVIGARGFPLGEHGQIGPVRDALYSNVLHIPWMMRLPDQTGALVRSQGLVQPADLFATLAAWHGLPGAQPGTGAQDLLPLMRGEVETVREQACSVAAGEISIRTGAWQLRMLEPDQARQDDEPGPSGRDFLYVKPDDRWEHNEISDRCPQIVTQLEAAIDQFRQAAAAEQLDQLPPLANELRDGTE